MAYNIRDTVLRLHEEGYSVLPSGGGKDGKSPNLTKWKNYQQKQPTDKNIESWLLVKKPLLWGIVTGKVSGVVVVDEDPGADPAIMSGLKPHVKTPRGGGHYWFEHPGHCVNGRVGVLPNVDIRGDGNFANTVGVNPKTSGEYTIKIMPRRDKLYKWEQMPKPILEVMNKDKDDGGHKPITHPIYEHDGRNDACARETGRLLSIYKDPEVVKPMVWAYNQAVCVPSLDEKECASTWEKSLAKWAKKAAPEPPQVVSAIELAEKEFPDLKFAIPDILPEGLTLLAGKPKCGKSWLVLLIAYSVALGRNLMNGSQIERGNALVLALEDGERRLKDRVSKIDAADCVLKEVTPLVSGGVHIVVDLGEGVPGGLDLATTWPKIGSDGIEELERYLDEHPDTRLIVIDVVKRFTKKKGKGTSYDEDYDSIQPIQELAKRRGIAILGVVHSRKAKSDDPFEMVSGTFGLTGSADSIMVLQREIGETYRLSITGRDIEPRELALKFKNCVWRVLGDATDYFISEKQKAILELLEHEILGPKEVAERLDMKEPTAKSTLWRMAKAGMLVNDNGKYGTPGR